MKLEPITPEELHKLFQQKMAKLEAERQAEEKRAKEYTLPPSPPKPQAPAVLPETSPKLSEPKPPIIATIPSGTSLKVTLIESLSTEFSKVGEIFQASLSQAVSAGNETLPAGTVFEGRINQLGRPGPLQAAAFLILTLNSFSVGGKIVSIQTNIARWDDAVKTTPFGEIWGKDLVLPSETVLEFRLAMDANWRLP